MVAYLFNNFKGYIIGAGALLASILYIYLKGKAAGAKDATKNMEEAIDKDVEDYNEIKDDVSRMSDSTLDSELRKWSRKR